MHAERSSEGKRRAGDGPSWAPVVRGQGGGGRRRQSGGRARRHGLEQGALGTLRAPSWAR
jgi:hypothetical protein